MTNPKQNYTIEEMYDYLHEYCNIGTEALDLAIGLNGYSKGTMCDVLYLCTGYRSFDQLDED